MRTLLAFVVMSAFAAANVGAQGLVSAGIGAGAGIGDRHKDSAGKGGHGDAYVQLHLPVFPVAFRVDGLLSKNASDKTMKSLMADAVYLLPIPVVQPYALAGYGKYDIGNDGPQSGWNAGVGVRVRTPVVAIFVDARRHQRIGRDLLTIGISR